MSKTLKLLKLRQVCQIAGASRATIDRWRDEGLFPEPVVLRRTDSGRPRASGGAPKMWMIG